MNTDDTYWPLKWEAGTHTSHHYVCACSRSGVIEKLEALELENPEKMEVEESGRGGGRQGRSEHRHFHREVTVFALRVCVCRCLHIFRLDRGTSVDQQARTHTAIHLFSPSPSWPFSPSLCPAFVLVLGQRSAVYLFPVSSLRWESPGDHTLLSQPVSQHQARRLQSRGCNTTLSAFLWQVLLKQKQYFQNDSWSPIGICSCFNWMVWSTQVIVLVIRYHLLRSWRFVIKNGSYFYMIPSGEKKILLCPKITHSQHKHCKWYLRIFFFFK